MNSQINEAKAILAELGFPKAQQNDRSALCLLALLDLTPDKSWQQAQSLLIGITPNTRETFRRQTMHQFVQSGLVLYNPDHPDRAVNSPKAVYQIEANALELLRHYGLPEWQEKLQFYLTIRDELAQKLTHQRDSQRIPVQIDESVLINLSPGEHSQLVKAVIQEFAPRFLPGCAAVYVGDTGEKWSYINIDILDQLGIKVDLHGKTPDIVLYFQPRNWLVIIEVVTSHGPINDKRKNELETLFAIANIQLVLITAFPRMNVLSKYLSEIAWETYVWIADQPPHLIHFGGDFTLD